MSKILIDGKTLREIRIKNGFKKYEIARHVGISLTAYDKWEHEVAAPSNQEKIDDIIEFLEINGYEGDMKVDLD